MLLLILGSCVAIAAFLDIKNVYSDYFISLRYAAFNVISMATDSGFVSTDYGSWPIFAPLWMLFLSCLCASTGSTGGGIKMFRSLILFKQSLREMFTLVHPQAVMPLKIAGQAVPNGVVYSVLAFIFLYFMTITVLTFALLISGLDFMTRNVGDRGLHQQRRSGAESGGPAGNYSALMDFQSWVCIAGMFLGRVEIITFAVLLTPTFWRK
jgi:trk system potassium uptake protein TrkH